MKNNVFKRVSTRVVKIISFIVIILMASALINSIVTGDYIKSLKFKVECCMFMLRNPNVKAELSDNSFVVNIEKYAHAETVGKKLVSDLILPGEGLNGYKFHGLSIRKNLYGQWDVEFDYVDEKSRFLKISQKYTGEGTTYVNDYSPNSEYISEKICFCEDITSNIVSVIYIGDSNCYVISGELEKAKAVDLIKKIAEDNAI